MILKVVRSNISDSGFYDYYLINGDKKLGMQYCDNRDLYFTSFERDKETVFFYNKRKYGYL